MLVLVCTITFQNLYLAGGRTNFEEACNSRKLALHLFVWHLRLSDLRVANFIFILTRSNRCNSIHNLLFKYEFLEVINPIRDSSSLDYASTQLYGSPGQNGCQR